MYLVFLAFTMRQDFILTTKASLFSSTLSMFPHSKLILVVYTSSYNVSFSTRTSLLVKTFLMAYSSAKVKNNSVKAFAVLQTNILLHGLSYRLHCTHFINPTKMTGIKKICVIILKKKAFFLTESWDLLKSVKS